MIDKSSLFKSQGSQYINLFIPKDGLFHKMLLNSNFKFKFQIQIQIQNKFIVMNPIQLQHTNTNIQSQIKINIFCIHDK